VEVVEALVEVLVEVGVQVVLVKVVARVVAQAAVVNNPIVEVVGQLLAEQPKVVKHHKEPLELKKIQLPHVVVNLNPEVLRVVEVGVINLKVNKKK
jgi:hypothetical protein